MVDDFRGLRGVEFRERFGVGFVQPLLDGRSVGLEQVREPINLSDLLRRREDDLRRRTLNHVAAIPLRESRKIEGE